MFENLLFVGEQNTTKASKFLIKLNWMKDSKCITNFNIWHIVSLSHINMNKNIMQMLKFPNLNLNFKQLKVLGANFVTTLSAFGSLCRR